MGLPSSGIISASDINIEAARLGTTNAPLGIQTGTAGDGSLVKLYEDATPSPGVDQNSPYAYSDFYGKSYTPPVISCKINQTEAINSGEGTGYFEAQLDFTATTGAIVVYFFVFTIPDGISFLYDSVTYNTLTSNTDGRITAAAGTNNIVGSSSYSGCTEASLIAGSGTNGYELTKSVWNGTSFGATGNDQSGLVAAASNINLSSAGITYTLVIPKTTASPSNGTLKIMAPCTDTGWRINIPCPITLPSFTTNSVNSTFQGACCATQNQTYYYVKNASINNPFNNFTIDTNTLPQVGNFVFSNSTGATALANGYYKITSNTAIYVQNGVVDSISTGCGSCTSVIGPISAGGRFINNSFQVCQSSSVTQYWYEGTAGTLPGVGDKCYDTSTVPGTVLPTGWYRRGPNFSDQKMQIGNTGAIITLQSC